MARWRLTPPIGGDPKPWKFSFEQEGRGISHRYQRTNSGLTPSVCLSPETRLSDVEIATGLKSGHWMSALPPKADVNGQGAGGPLLTQSGHLRAELTLCQEQELATVVGGLVCGGER